MHVCIICSLSAVFSLYLAILGRVALIMSKCPLYNFTFIVLLVSSKIITIETYHALKLYVPADHYKSHLQMY